MPTDFKRITGPEETLPYSLFSKNDLNQSSDYFTNSLSNDIRFDKRKCNEHRKIFLRTGAVSQAKGSAYLEQGKTKVIVSVFDPREIPSKSEYSQKGILYCEFKYATFSCPIRRNFQQDSEEKQNSILIKQALESAICLHEYPNFQIDVYIMVLENDGSAVSAAITCAGTALANAGIAMYDIITAVTLGFVNGTRLIDPTLKEESMCQISPSNRKNEISSGRHGLIIASILSTHEQISQFYQTGNLQNSDVRSCVDVVIHTSVEIVPIVQKALVKYVTKCLEENDKSKQ